MTASRRALSLAARRAAVLVALVGAAVLTTGLGTTGSEESMMREQGLSGPLPAAPPVDLAAPAAVETATFAFG